MRPQLRIFVPDDEQVTAVEAQSFRVSIGQLTRFMAGVARPPQNRLRKFSDDEVEISPELYSLLRNFVEMRPGA